MDSGSIQEKLSYVGSQLDTALNETESVKDHVDKLDNDTKAANNRLDALEMEIAAVKKNIPTSVTDGKEPQPDPFKL